MHRFITAAPRLASGFKRWRDTGVAPHLTRSTRDERRRGENERRSSASSARTMSTGARGTGARGE